MGHFLTEIDELCSASLQKQGAVNSLFLYMTSVSPHFHVTFCFLGMPPEFPILEPRHEISQLYVWPQVLAL